MIVPIIFKPLTGNANFVGRNAVLIQRSLLCCGQVASQSRHPRRTDLKYPLRAAAIPGQMQRMRGYYLSPPPNTAERNRTFIGELSRRMQIYQQSGCGASDSECSVHKGQSGKGAASGSPHVRVWLVLQMACSHLASSILLTLF